MDFGKSIEFVTPITMALEFLILDKLNNEAFTSDDNFSMSSNMITIGSSRLQIKLFNLALIIAIFNLYVFKLSKMAKASCLKVLFGKQVILTILISRLLF